MEQDLVKTEQDEIKAEQDKIKAEQDEIKEVQDKIKEEQDIIQAEKNFVKEAKYAEAAQELLIEDQEKNIIAQIDAAMGISPQDIADCEEICQDLTAEFRLMGLDIDYEKEAYNSPEKFLTALHEIASKENPKDSTLLPILEANDYDFLEETYAHVIEEQPGAPAKKGALASVAEQRPEVMNDANKVKEKLSEAKGEKPHQKPQIENPNPEGHAPPAGFSR